MFLWRLARLSVASQNLLVPLPPNTLLLCCSLLLHCGAAAADWPQWRGLHRDGRSAEEVSTHWPATGPKALWQASVGTGFSSVSIAKGWAYTLGNTNNEDTLWCFDARTGRRLWYRTYAARLDPQWFEGGPTATPAVADGRVYSISKAGEVFCLDAGKGSVLWKRDLRQDGLKAPRWGYSGSPLLWRNLVILNAGTAGMALDSRTGRIAWSTGTNACGYSSPKLLVLHGREAIVLFAAKHLVCLDPATGRELWRHFWETGWDTNITDPLVQDGFLLISSFTRGCALLDITPPEPRVVYDSKVLLNHLSPGIPVGDYLYAFSGEAKQDTDYRCIHLPSGRLEWKTKDPSFGSAIFAGGRIVVLSAKGELLVLQPSPEAFQPLARSQVLSGTCWTPPALADGLLYVRNAKGELRCLDVRPRGPGKS